MHFWYGVIVYLTTMQIPVSVYGFRDYPFDNSNPSPFNKNFQDSSRNTSNRQTIYEKSLSNILTRKKRGFVFFKGAVVVLTQVLSKAIIAPTPRGVLQSSEIDMFYDLPILIEGWKKPLETFVNRTKGPKKSDKTINVDYVEDEINKNIGVINASSIPWTRYYKKNSYGPMLNRFASFNKNSWNRNSNIKQKYFYRKPHGKGSFYNYYYPNYQRRNYNQIAYYNKNYMTKGVNQYSTVKNNQKAKKPQKLKVQQIKNTNPNWHDHREYRERRGIFEHVEEFGKKLGISLRSCVLRAICEMKKELLPQGESFINDVARILFTIPTNHHDKDDDFVQMALEDGVDCVRRFMVSCPHSPLRYFANNFRATSLPSSSASMSEEDMMRSVMYA